MSARRRLPNRRASRFFDFASMDMTFAASFSCDAKGNVAEIFLDNHKGGSAVGTLVRPVRCDAPMTHPDDATASLFDEETADDAMNVAGR
jgi:hypothetical protein